MIRRYLPKNVQELVRWYERYISPLALISGFLADNLILLRRVDLWRSNALLFTYLAVAALGIVFVNLIQTGRLRHHVFITLAPIIPVIMQFAFGGLFSGYLSLYSRSASFAISWVFVALLTVLLLGNERFTRLYVRFSFQLSLFFFVLYSFLIFFLPVITHQLGPLMFLIAGTLSLLLITLFLIFLQHIVPEVAKPQSRKVVISVISICVIMNILYFTNAMPPLPLAVKDATIAHSVTKDGSGNYTVSAESLPWYEDYLNYNVVYHRIAGEPVYAWTAIFAPSGLSIRVLHEWQRYDTSGHSWHTIATVPFRVNGGRDGGYRGYSVLSNPQEGSWRVNVITEYGQIIGRIDFSVQNVTSAVALKTDDR